MTINEIAAFLGCASEQVKTIISIGVKLPKSGILVKLEANKSRTHTDITEEQLDAFIKRFEDEEPGRHPPVDVRVKLLTETRHHCAICRRADPLQFHHLTEWAILKHHDPTHMLAICGSCHTKCTNGLIDHRSQMAYKDLLKAQSLEHDPERVLKLAKDKKIVTEIFGGIPSRYVDIFLEELKSDKYWYDLPLDLDDLTMFVSSPQFYLYDKDLWRLLKDFLVYWNAMTVRGSLFYHDGAGRGVGYLMPEVNNHEVTRRGFETFKELLKESKRALAELHSHVREKYPDIDIDELGIKASDEALRRVQEIRARMIAPRLPA